MRSCMFLISLILWIRIPYYGWNSKILFFIFVLFITSLTRFCLLMVGWRSFRKYGALGRIRRVAQILSFEINFGIFLFLLFFLKNKIVLVLKSSVVFIFWCLLIFWILLIIETQRAPIDLSERERELVSGYNTEFSSIYFTLIFLSEYLNILFFTAVLMILLLNLKASLWFLIICCVLLIRSCFPRIRFDTLLEISWLKLLPVVSFIVLIIYPIKFL